MTWWRNIQSQVGSFILETRELLRGFQFKINSLVQSSLKRVWRTDSCQFQTNAIISFLQCFAYTRSLWSFVLQHIQGHTYILFLTTDLRWFSFATVGGEADPFICDYSGPAFVIPLICQLIIWPFTQGKETPGTACNGRDGISSFAPLTQILILRRATVRPIWLWNVRGRQIWFISLLKYQN